MVNRMLLLECEDVNIKECLEIKRKFLSSTKRKIVLIIPWSTRNSEKEIRYRRIIREYFKDLGIRSIFLNREDTLTQVEEKFNSVDVIYLPGGDTFLLLREIRKRNIEKFIENFNGLIIGNSAGALILSKCFFSSENSKGLFHKGLGLVNFCLVVHYTEERVSNILELSHGREIIALSNGSSVIVKNDRIVETWGKVFKINNGNMVRL